MADMGASHRLSDRGMALLIVVATISVLAVLVISFNQRVRSSMTRAFYYQSGARLQAVAESGVDIGLSVLYDDVLSTEYDALVEPWSRLEGVALDSLFGQGSLRVRIDDLSGYFPINRLVSEAGEDPEVRSSEMFRAVLIRLLNSGAFAVEGEEQVLIVVDSLTDWLDGDDSPLPYGAENDYYFSLERPYPARNGAPETIDELLQVRGMTPDILYGSDEKRGLSEYITIHGRTPININTAPLLLFSALAPDIPDDFMEEVDEFRSDPESAPLLAEPGWHRSLPGWPQNSVIEPALVATRSLYFKISAAARDGNQRLLATAVAGRSEEGMTIFYRSVN